MIKVEKFKSKILSNINDVDIDFEVGYCYKKRIETKFKENYWNECYFFLKGLAKQNNILCLR